MPLPCCNDFWTVRYAKVHRAFLGGLLSQKFSKEGLMMLFKILKGDSSRISMDKTAFHEGYAYFTPDDAGFYIDAKVGNNNKRLRLNERASSINATLSASAWSNKQQSVSVSGLSASQNGLVDVANGATAAQLSAVSAARLRVKSQAAGSITFAADGTVPTIDIPITVVLLP